MDIGSYLYPIVSKLVPQEIPEESVRALTHELAAVLSSARISPDDLSKVVDNYKSKSAYTSENVAKWQKLESISQLLANYQSKDEIAKYLDVMNSVLLDNIPQRPNKNVSSYLNRETLQTHNHLLTPTRAPSVYAESFENVDRFSDRRSGISSAYAAPLGENTGPSLANLASPYYSTAVSEEEMLKYISYTLLATTSSLFPFSKNKVEIPVNVSNGESGVLHLIFEAGLLYQYLSFKVESHKSSRTLSPLKMSILTYTSQQLRHYVGFVNDATISGHMKSLKATYLVLYDQILIFRFYYSFIQRFDQFRGDQFLSEFDSLRHHGDPLISSLSNNIFQSLIILYYEYLTNWLTKGQLDETYKEFFIEAGEINNTHDSKIPVAFQKDKIPGFISLNVAEEIYMVGKTYIFLEKYCKEIRWASDFTNKYTSRYQALSMEEFSENFSAIVHSQYKEVNQFANYTLKTKFFYTEVIDTLKNILLMGKGDFIETMINKASDFLLEPSSSLPSYRLTRSLQDAVQQSSLRNMLRKHDNNFIINKLDARVLELGHGSIGWDVFTLDYLIEPPLSIMLNVNREDGQKEYLRVFNFLWRIKKNNYFYQEEWLRNNSLTRDFKKIRRYRPLVKDMLSKISKVNSLKSKIQRFNNKLETYCFQSIVDTNYCELKKKLSFKDASSGHKFNIISIKSGLKVVDGILKPDTKLLPMLKNHAELPISTGQYNIDELDTLHNQYLHNIITHKLLDSSSSKNLGAYTNQYYPATVIILLNEIFEFIVAYSEFNNIVHEILIQLSLENNEELNALLARFNLILKNIVKHYKTFQNHSYFFIKDLKADNNEDLIKLSRILR